MQNTLKPKRPIVGVWIQAMIPSWTASDYAVESWFNPVNKLFVISAVEPSGSHGEHDEYHLSVSREGFQRCTDKEVKQILEQFCMENAEEDNPIEGAVPRNFWLSASCKNTVQ